MYFILFQLNNQICVIESLGLDLNAANRTAIIVLKPFRDARAMELVETSQCQQLVALVVLLHADDALLVRISRSREQLCSLERRLWQLV